MRNALILLAVVALLILAVGALNNGTAFDIDYVAGTVSAVSLFWVSAVIAALVFVVGLAAAWFAQVRRGRLAAQARGGAADPPTSGCARPRPWPPGRRRRPSPRRSAVVVAATEVAEAETVVAAEEATVVAGADETVLAREDVTLVAGEEATVVAGEEAAVVADDPGTGVASDVPGEPGEQTAVTMAGATPAGEAGAPAGDTGRARRTRLADGAPAATPQRARARPAGPAPDVFGRRPSAVADSASCGTHPSCRGGTLAG